MGRRALKVCPTPGCPTLVEQGRCDDCKREAEQSRGTAAQRGYNSAAHQRFRIAVLRRDPICVVCHAAPSEHADHHPLSRRELIDTHQNPNDPRFGRGVCPSCHSRETAEHQPGGWHARNVQ